MQKQKKWLIGICSMIIFCAIVGISYILFLSNSTYSLLDNHVRVEEDSELTYYLDILYDGKDKNLVMSSDEAIADVRSDYIYIEDKIPDGLTFIGFVNSADGSIGAVKRNDGVTKCGGYVIDGVNGLSYNEATRTVSFKIRNLQAGCKLTVGIITKTPFLGEKTRMDFYNTAFGRENLSTTKSNTVHVYLGRDIETLYSVTYQYTGDVPENAPTLPEPSEYIEGTTVGLISDITVPGYTFSGWQTTSATIANSSFVMPASNVVIQGSFTKNQTYTVSYELEGTNQPDNYILPKTKSYGAGEEITVDSLKAGDVIGGYKFLGWTSTDVEIVENEIFTMPEKNVTLKGSFELAKYSVTYQFQGDVLPPNAETLLPESRSYLPGETVAIAANPVADGYDFSGWYRTESFKMPEEDVVILGEWIAINGYFSPKIIKTISTGEVQPKEKIKMVALGDSVSGGKIPGGTYTGGYNKIFSDYLSEKGELESYQNIYFEYILATQLIDYLQGKAGNQDKLTAISSADLISLNLGNNDAYELKFWDSTFVSGFLSGNEAANTQAYQIVDTISEKMEAVMAQLREMNSKADVILYVPYFNFESLNGVETARQRVDALYQYWLEKYEAIAEKYNCMIVNCYQVFRSSGSKYVTTNDPHPNADGYQKIAEKLIEVYEESAATNPPDNPNPPISKQKVKFVALGDSVSGGKIPGGTYTGGYNKLFSDYLNDKEELESYQNIYFEYILASQVIEYLQGKLGNQDKILQISSADLISLNLGNNDAYELKFLDSTFITGFLSGNEAANTQAYQIVDTISEKIESVMVQLREMNSKADVILYVPYFNFESLNGVETARQRVDALYQYWLMKYELIAEKYNCMIVNCYQVFRSSGSKYVTTNDPHPNADGYQKIAEKLIEVYEKYTSSNTPVQQEIELLGLGDSLGWGYLTDTGKTNGGYNAIFKDYLVNKGIKVNYLNASISGLRATQLLEMMQPDSGYDLSRFSTADIITLSIGGNDASDLGFSKYEFYYDANKIPAAKSQIDEVAVRVDAVMQKLREINPNAIIIIYGHGAWIEALAEVERGRANIDQVFNYFASKYSEIAEKYNAVHVDGYQFTRSSGTKYLPIFGNPHFNDAGYQKAAEAIIEAYEAIPKTKTLSTRASQKSTTQEEKQYYSKGEKIIFDITVTNTASYAIRDVYLQEQTEGSTFITGRGYTILNDQLVRIGSIPAGKSIIVQAEYTVGDDLYKEEINTVELVGALADNNYYLDTSKEYKAYASFKISNISLEIIKKNPEGNLLEGAEFALYEDQEATKLIGSGLKYERLAAGKTYYLKETKPPLGYKILRDVLPVTINSNGVITIENYTVEQNNGNYSVVIFNQKINILPNTGGIGTVPFIIGGLLIIMGASAGYIYMTKRKIKPNTRE